MPKTIKATIALPIAELRVAAPSPDLVSQKTSEAMFGIPRRTFLASLGDYRATGGEIIRLGRLRLVRRDEYITWLANRQFNEEPQDVAELAEALGLRLVDGQS